MSCDCSETFEICVNEGSQKEYSAILKDQDDAPVPLAALTDIVVTLKDVETGEVINDRDAQTVKNANGGTYHATTGALTVLFSELDNVIVTDGSRTERHIATFLATWSGGRHQWDVIVKVKNLGLTAID